MPTPKPVVNNRIDYRSIGGIVNRLDTFVNQAVANNSSPTFGSLHISGDTTIAGNLYVEGNTTVIDSLVTEYQDNIILLNNNELGPGVSLLQAGIEIDRGSLENYRIVYNELSQTFRVGVISNTQPVVVREDTPLSNGIMIWNNSTKRIEGTKALSLDISILNTTNSVNATTGALWTLGGVGITKDLFINGIINMKGCTIDANTSGSLSLSASGNIHFLPGDLISIPNNTKLIFGSTNQSIQYNSVSNVLNIQSGTKINFNFVGGINQSINIPNQIPITFATPTEKIFTDSSNNMVIAGSQDIQLNPGSSKKILIPLNTNLSFSNANQYIVANAGGDLTIASGNNIFLNPNAVGGIIRIPTSNAIKLGNSGNQTILGDSNNDLNITATNNINITSSSVKLSNNTTISWTNQSMSVDTAGNLYMNNGTQGSVYISNTQDATNATNGALIINGGLNVSKNIYAAKDFTLKSTNSNLIVQNNVNTILNVSTNNTYGQIVLSSGDGTNTNPGIIVSSNNILKSQNLLQLNITNQTINSYYIGRDRENTIRNFNINIPSHSDYGNSGDKPCFSVTTNDTSKTIFSVESDTSNVNIYGAIVMRSTQDSISSTTGSFILYGGLAVAKNIYTNGDIRCITNSTSAVVVNSTNTSGNSLLTIDTVNNVIDIYSDLINVNDKISISQNYMDISSEIIISNTTNSSNQTTAAVIVEGGISVQKDVSVYGSGHFYSDLNLHNNTITNVKSPIQPSDVATKSYVDLVKQGMYVKDSVIVGTLISHTLNTDFHVGATIDSYVLTLGDRILIKNQADPLENGIYVITNSTPTRTDDFKVGEQVSGFFVFIEQGFNNGNTGWICNSVNGSDVVGTDPITFTQFTGIGSAIAGNGISIDVNTISVNIDNSSLEFDINNNIQLSQNIIGTGLLGGSGVILQTDPNQTHVNQLGNIVVGEWNATSIAVQFGGTGQSEFSPGTILYGNGTNNILSDTTFVFDENNTRLGIGVTEPSETLHMESLSSCSILIDSNTDNIDANATSKIILKNTGNQIGLLGINKNSNQLFNNIYPDTIVLSNSITSGGLSGSGGSIQLVTNQLPRFTILRNGNIGIGTTSPSKSLDINGDLKVSQEISSYGPITIHNSSASALHVIGSTILDSDVTINGTLNTTGVINLNKLNITDTSDSTGFTNGSLCVAGGMSVVKNVNIGGDVQLNGFYFNTSTNKNYIQSPDNSHTLNSFIPIHIIKFNDYSNPITSFTDTGLLINNCNTLRLGGTTNVPGGYTFMFNNTDGNLYLTPHNTNATNATLIIGTTSNLSDVSVVGNNGSMHWNANESLLNLINTPLNISNQSGSSFNINYPDHTGKVIVNGDNVTQLSCRVPLSLSNSSGNDIITFTPGYTQSTLTLSDKVTATFDGSVLFNDTITYANNQFVSISNTENASAWNYIGPIASDAKIHMKLYCNDYSSDLILDNNSNVLSTSFTYSEKSSQTEKPHVYIYNDNSVYKIFLHTPTLSTVSLCLLDFNNTFGFSYMFDGTNTEPDSYDISWTLSYSTVNESQTFTDVHVGNHYAEKLFVSANTPVISYNTSQSKDLGLAMQRYQLNNDVSEGDIINNDSPSLVVVLESQITLAANQTKLNNANPSNDYYNNWWIKFNSQVRKIVSYIGAQQLLVLDSDWTTQPQENDTVSLYQNSYVISAFKESTKELSFGYTSNIDTVNINVDNYIDIRAKNIHSQENIYASGILSISSTQNATSFTNGGALTVLGGASINSKLLVGERIGINTTSPQDYMQINCGTSGNGILLQGSASSITLSNNNSKIGLQDSCLFIKNGESTITCKTNGNIGFGINTSAANTIVSPLTLKNSNLICTDADNGYIGLNSGNSNSVNDTNAQVVLYGNSETSGNSGNVNIYLGNTSGTFNINNISSSLFEISNTGIVRINNTEPSHASHGSLITHGGISILSTENSQNSSQGGALTVIGGASITKNMYIGGDLNFEGALNATNIITQPTIVFNNTLNCTVTSHNNVQLTTISSQNTLSFYVVVTPNSANDCEFVFTLPNKTNNLTFRGDCIVNISGWTNDTASSVEPLFNTIGVGIGGTKTVKVQFQSINTDLHYIQLICIYNK